MEAIPREVLHRSLKDRRDRAENKLKNLESDRTRSTKPRNKAYLRESQQARNDELFTTHMRVEQLKHTARSDSDPALDSNVLAEELRRSTKEGVERAVASEILRDMLIYYEVGDLLRCITPQRLTISSLPGIRMSTMC